METKKETAVILVDFEQDDTYDSDSFVKLKMKLAHDGKNPKGLIFTKDALINAAPTIVNKPILARVVFDSDNEPQFTSHDRHLEKDYQGNIRIVYDELPIGMISETSDYVVEFDEDTKRYYAYCVGYIWKKYSNYALDIIERDKSIKLSIEIQISDFETDSETKEVTVTDFRYDGVTLLGNDRKPGMVNAGATTEFDLDSEQEDENIKGYLKEFVQEFKKILTEFDDSKEGGEFNLEKEEALKEPVEEQKTEAEFEEKNTEDEAEIQPTEVQEKDKEFDVEEAKDKEQAKAENEEFELTARETSRKLSNALDLLFRNASRTYSYLKDFDSNYVYYKVEVYSEETGYVTTDYRRSYKLVGEEVSFGEDEVETVVKILTKDEWKTLEAERDAKNVEFEDLKKFKETTLENQRKDALEKVFEKFDKKLVDSEDYQNLKKDNINFSIEEIENRCFAICGRLDFDKEPVVENKDEDVVKVQVEQTFEDKPEKEEYCGGYLNSYYAK